MLNRFADYNCTWSETHIESLYAGLRVPLYRHIDALIEYSTRDRMLLDQLPILITLSEISPGGRFIKVWKLQSLREARAKNDPWLRGSSTAAEGGFLREGCSSRPYTEF